MTTLGLALAYLRGFDDCEFTSGSERERRDALHGAERIGEALMAGPTSSNHQTVLRAATRQPRDQRR